MTLQKTPLYWPHETENSQLRRVFRDALTPSELLRRVFLGAGAPRNTRRVFLGAGAPKLLRRLPPHFSVGVQHGTNCGESGTTCCGTCPGPSAFVESTVHSVARRLLPQCRCGGESCVQEHAAHRAVAGAWWRRLRTRSRRRAQTNSAQVKRPSSRLQRQAVRCLPGAWVETGHAALPGPGQSRTQAAASGAQTPRKSASQAGGAYHASTVAGRPGARAPGRHHTAGRSVQRGRATDTPSSYVPVFLGNSSQPSSLWDDC